MAKTSADHPKKIKKNMEPTPNPSEAPQPPPLDGADIAVDADVPKLPAVPASPRRLFVRDGGTDRRSERPSKSIDPRPSPRRVGAGAANGGTGRSGPSPAAVVAWDSFGPSPPRPRAAVTVSPEQALRLRDVVEQIRSRPVSKKRAILPQKALPPRKKSAAVAKSKAPVVKATPAATKRSTQKKNSILSSDFL